MTHTTSDYIPPRNDLTSASLIVLAEHMPDTTPRQSSGAMVCYCNHDTNAIYAHEFLARQRGKSMYGRFKITHR